MSSIVHSLRSVCRIRGVVLLLFLAVPPSVHAQWLSFDRPGMEFRALAVTDSTIFAFGSPGALHKSTDNGSTWTVVKWHAPLDHTGLSLSIIDGIPVGGTGDGSFLRGRNFSYLYHAVAGTGDDICAVGSTRRDSVTTWYLGGLGGGVRRSTDAGLTWTLCNEALTNLTVTSLVTIPGSDTAGPMLFAGTYDGVFRSSDEGSHWTGSSTGLGEPHVHAMMSRGDTLYAAQDGGRVSWSPDGGASWSALGTGLPATAAISLASLTRHGGRSLFAGTSEAGIWRYNDVDTQWTPANTGLKSLRCNAIVSKDSLLFTATEHGIHRSADGGAHWELISDGATPLVSSVFAASFPGGGPATRLFAVSDAHYYLKDRYTGGTGAGDLCSAVSWTDDLGTTWTTTPFDPNFISRSFRFLHFAVQHHDDIFLFSTGKGDYDRFRFQLSSDRGATWREQTEPRADMTRTTLSGVVIRDLPGGQETRTFITFAYGPYAGMHRSLDAGTTWSGISLPANGKIFDPLLGTDSMMYAASLTSALRSSDGGGTWDRILYNGVYPYHTPPGSLDSRPMFTLLHANNDRLFARVVPAIIPGDPGGLYVSTDQGTTWTPAGFTGLLVDRIIESDTLLFALQNGHVYASRTDSLAWQDVSGELATDSIVVISASPEHLVALTETSDRIWYRPMTEIRTELNTTGPTATPRARDELPATVTLLQNYPNPFNPATTIGYQIPVSGQIKLTVIDLLGREVEVLVDEHKTAGRHEVRFDASGLASGVYFYRLHITPSTLSGAIRPVECIDTKVLMVIR